MTDAAATERLGITAIVTAVLGLIALVVSFTALNWFSSPRLDTLTFADSRDLLSRDNAATGFATAYFTWAAWLFAVIVTLCGIAASMSSPLLRLVRVIGVVTGVSAAGLTFLAIQLDKSRLSYHGYLSSAREGFYVAVVGFLLGACASAVGPEKEGRS